VTYGLGAGGGGASVSFVMRAFHTIFPTGFVYWTVPNVPDSAGAFGPYPAIDLADIVVIREYVPGP
jgi:hypothetical protein